MSAVLLAACLIHPTTVPRWLLDVLLADALVGVVVALVLLGWVLRELLTR